MGDRVGAVLGGFDILAANVSAMVTADTGELG